MNALTIKLKKYAMTKPGVRQSSYFDDTLSLLNGFLDGVLETFEGRKGDGVLLRVKIETRRTLQKLSKSIAITKRMGWDTVKQGWQWAEVWLDGSIPLETLYKLVDESYELTFNSLEEKQQKVVLRFAKKMTEKEFLSELIDVNGFSKRRAEIEKLIKPAVLLKTSKAKESAMKVGQTKLGGLPDLPKGTVWPEYEGKPLGFLAQVNLGEVPAKLKPKNLPTTGILYFFTVYGWTTPEGSDPDVPKGKYNARWTKVIYHPRTSGLVRAIAASGTEIFKTAKAEFVQFNQLPSHTREPAIAKLGWGGSQKERYEELLESYDSAICAKVDYPPLHLLAGYATYVQEFVTPVAKEGLELLFQIGSDENSGTSWGDDGIIYFFIKPADLKKKKFDNVYTDYQCG